MTIRQVMTFGAEHATAPPRSRNAVEVAWHVLHAPSYLRTRFRQNHGYEPDLANPRTFSEKLAFRRLYQRSAVFSRCSNKETVRDFARERLGRDISVELFGCFRRIARRDLEAITEPCVIKPSHGSGRATILVKPEPDEIEALARRYNRLVNTPSWLSWRHQFFPRRRSIIVERFLGDVDGAAIAWIPLDYRFHCFRGRDGRFDFVLSVNNRNHGFESITFFDSSLRPIPLCFANSPRDDEPIAFPDNFSEMVDVARTLSEGLGYVRVDLYNVRGRIHLGEITFVHRGGLSPVTPASWDRTLGEMWDLGADPR